MEPIASGAGRRLVRAWLLSSAFGLALSSAAAAQVTTGTMVGSVTDPTGQPLHAEVRVSDDLHHFVRTSMTDDAGSYRLADLAPATYDISVSASGFRSVTRRDVAVKVDSTARIDFQLPLATIAESVDVVAPTQVVETSSGGLGTVLDRQRIDALPLNRRDFLQLALLTPGVEGPVQNSELSSRGGVAMHANGGREEMNNFLLDGVDNNDPYVNRYVVQAPLDSVQEFKVATNGYGADYGRNAAGQVNVITRAGTNRFDGSGYEYFRNRALNARNYFEENGKQSFERNQAGGSVGGPIAADRTFFFGTVDVLREHQGLSRLGSVPTAADRLGNLSDLGTPVVNPFTGQAFAGNIIPSGLISPLAQQMVSLFPSPNRAGALNYIGQPLQTDNQTQGLVRVDHQLSSADRLMFRYSGGSSDLLEPYIEGNSATAGFGDVVNDRTWNVTAQYERVFHAAATNTLRFGANGFRRDILTQNHGTDVGSLWNVNWLNVPSQSFGYPVLNVAGYNQVGDAFSLPILRTTATYQLLDDLAIDKGKHLIKIGGDVRHIKLDSQVDLFSRGQLSFTGAFTGSGIGDLLLGLPTFGIQAQANNPIRMRTDAFSAYLQDDWRVKPNLTLNLGVRYEYASPPVDAANGMSTLNLATGQVVNVGTNGISRSGINPDRNNLAPRVGMTWSPAIGTVVRAGYGVFYDSAGMLTVNTAQYFNPPYFNVRVFVPSAQGLLTLANPFPLNSGFLPPATLSILSPNLVNSSFQHWNAGVQRDLPLFGSVTVAYAGSKGSHLVRGRDLNQPSPGPGDVQARRPNPAYGDIFLIESAGRSRFDSLQVTLDRPLTRNVSLLAAYTLARSNDDASAFLGVPTDPNFPQNSSNPGAEWGPSSFDVRHRLTVAYIVSLPNGNRWTRDTQIEGITVLHTGQPLTPLLRFDNSNTGNVGGSTAGSDRPNVVGNTALDNPTADEWFNTRAFSIPAAYTFGNAGRNSVRGPGYGSFDLAVSRRVRLHERAAVTLSVQCFNLFNRTNFDMPQAYADEPSTFGRILSAEAPRQVQLAARFSF